MNSRLFPNSEKAKKDRESLIRARSIISSINRQMNHPSSSTAQEVERLAGELQRTVQSVRSGQATAQLLSQAAGGLRGMLSAGEPGFVRRMLRSIGLLDRWYQSGEGRQSLQATRERVRQLSSLVDQLDSSITKEEQQQQQIAVQRDRQAAASRSASSSSSSSPSSSSSSASSQAQRPSFQRVDGRPTPPNGMQSNVEILPDGSWRVQTGSIRRVYRANDPRITGEMVPVRSSNVHSIGMELNLKNLAKSTLYIRFKVKGRSGGGTYAVYDCWPELFDELIQAPSKGMAYWDKVRVRGTVSGHQYKYSLVRADMIRGAAYLPRRAITTSAGIQRFVRRERTAVFSNGRSEIVRSPLANQTLGRLSPTAHQPNYGNPRGGMDRGNPPRGPETRRR